MRVSNTSAELRALNSQDAAKLLYSNTIAGCSITLASSTVLAFGFSNPDIAGIKFFWWLVMLSILTARLLDGIYWQHKIRPRNDFDGDAAQRRYLGQLAAFYLQSSQPTRILDHDHSVVVYGSGRAIRVGC